jgi:PTS system nitrogen regulatory IIA component
MPHRTLEIKEVAQYLRLNPLEIERLVKEQDIPFERRGARVLFRKTDIDAWASPRILGLEGRRLADYHQKTSLTTPAESIDQAILPGLLKPEYINPFLPAKTKASVLREMINLAERTGRVWDPRGLLAGLQAREALSSTGLPGGLALLHTRERESYLFESMFLVLGRTTQEVPFGAPDGRPTTLFFLVACPDAGVHLHTLARLCLMAQKGNILQELRDAQDAESMLTSLLRAEQEVLEAKPQIR